MKEVQLRPGIGRQDLQVKCRTARELLLSEGSVKLTVVFRGTEMSHPELGARLLRILTERLKDVGQSDRPQLRGRLLSVIVRLDEEGGARVPAYTRDPAPTLQGGAQAVAAGNAVTTKACRSCAHLRWSDTPDRRRVARCEKGHWDVAPGSSGRRWPQWYAESTVARNLLPVSVLGRNCADHVTALQVGLSVLLPGQDRGVGGA